MSRLADDLEALRRALGVERWIFAGTSTGGMVGLLYALRHPRGVAALILNGSAPSWRYREEPASIYNPAHPRWPLVRDAIEATRRGEPDAAWRWTAAATLPSLRRPERLAELLAERGGGLAAGRLASIRVEMPTYDVVDRLGEISLPTLVTCGRYDTQCPLPQSELIARRVPNAELVVFEESGHFPYFEEPGRYRETVARFVRERVSSHLEVETA